MADDFDKNSSGLDSPAYNAEAVTPSDSVNLAKTSRGVYVGVAGDISVEMAGTGTAIVFTGVLAGSILPIRITRVNSTGTTATNMTSLY
jgi:hypothetical protein